MLPTRVSRAGRRAYVLLGFLADGRIEDPQKRHVAQIDEHSC
jgi:hypothetical protein